MKKVEIPEIEGVNIEFRCATCRDWHKTWEAAQACYKRGTAEQIIPSGSIVALRGYENMVFVVASFSRRPNEHRGGYRLWGFRDTQAGDNTGDDYCGDDLMHVEYVVAGQTDPRYYPLPENDKWLREIAHDNYKVNTKTPAFKRAVKFIRAMELTPQYWNGKKFVAV